MEINACFGKAQCCTTSYVLRMFHITAFLKAYVPALATGAAPSGGAKADAAGSGDAAKSDAAGAVQPGMPNMGAPAGAAKSDAGKPDTVRPRAMKQEVGFKTLEPPLRRLRVRIHYGVADPACGVRFWGVYAFTDGQVGRGCCCSPHQIRNRQGCLAAT